DKSLEDCIREHLFAYGEGAESRKVKQPPGTLPLSAVSPKVAKLFERAFLTDDKRPEPREWIEALEDLSNNLEQCALHPGHLYYVKLNACPWCEIESNTGLMLFPFIGGKNNAAGQESFNIFTIENLIASFNVSQNLPAKPVKPTVLPPPSPEILDVRKATRQRQIILIAIQLFVVITFSVLVGFGSVCFVGLILMIFMTVILDGSAKSIKKDLQDRLQTARYEWDKLEYEWEQAESGQKLNEDIAQIRGKVTEYQNLHQLNRRKTQSLRDEIFSRRVNEYLDSVRLDDAAEFIGVENGRLEALKNFGIKTAADIESKRYLLSVPGVDDNLASKLVDWRKELERKLDYDSESKIPETEQERLTQETAGMRRKIEKEVEMLLGVLRLGSVNLRHRQQKLLAKSEALAGQLLQTESDLSAVGSNAPAIVALVLITFLTPIWGIAFREMLSPPKPFPTNNNYPVTLPQKTEPIYKA
ncbi:MAG: hypothetical protein LC778_09905, partial [Acidobacteria bacterium]|nr:hypothetical protein [Acidobacteriota bacterium]